MLEQLGLGIILSFEDNFTPQANNAVNSMFRLETQAEQMSANVQKSLNNLQNLMLSGFSLTQIGDEFQSAGKAITGVFKGMFERIADASARMETFKAQFKTVFGNQAENKLKWAVDFAVKTPFELPDLISSMQRMGSQKIDISKMFKNSKGQNKAFIEYMGDLATRNMGANGGLEGMGIAISNAWSGQLRSLEQRFDLAKQDMKGLKNYAGKDQAKFMQEFVKLADKYAPNAMKNLEGTWEQTMSNMNDATFNLFKRLGDKDGGSDVFGSMKKSLNEVAGLLFEVSNSDKMLGTLRKIFHDLWQPVDKLVDALTRGVRAIFKFAEAHPQIASLVTKFTALLGIALIAVGTITKLTGGVMIFTTSLISAYANLKILKSLNLAGDLAGIARGFGLIGAVLKTSTLLLGTLGLAYHYNIGGARDELNKLGESFKTAIKYKDQLMSANATNRDTLFAQSNKDLGHKIGFTIAKFEAMKLVAKNAYETVEKGESKILQTFTQNHYDPVKRFGLEEFNRTIPVVIKGFKDFVSEFKIGLGEAYQFTKKIIGYLFEPFIAIGRAIKEAFGVANVDDAKNFADALKTIGRLAGNVLGALLGFKIVKGLGSILISPFKSLLGMLGRVEQKAVRVMSKLNPSNWFTKGSMKSFENKVKIRHQVNALTGKAHDEASYKKMGLGLTRGEQKAGYVYQKRRLEEASGRTFTRGQLKAMGIEKPNSIITSTIKSFADSFKLVGNAVKSKSQLVGTGLSNDPYSRQRVAKFNPENERDKSISDILLRGKGFNGDTNVEVAKRPKWMDVMFGQKFSTVNSQGQRNEMGSYGGVLTKLLDDKQMRLASQVVKPQAVPRSNFSTEAEYQKYQKTLVKQDRGLGMTASSLPSNYDEAMYNKINKNLSTYIGSGKAGVGQFRITKGMDEAEITNRRSLRHQAVMGVMKNDPSVLGQYANRSQNKIDYVNEKYKANSPISGKEDHELFAKKQGFMSRALFGQKYYTVEKDAKGKLFENEVSRSGGIFNKPEEDGRLNVKGKGGLGGFASGLGSAVMSDMQSVKQSLMGTAIAFGGKMKGLGGMAKSALLGSEFFGFMKETFSSVASNFKMLGGDIKTKVNSMFAGAKGKIQGSKFFTPIATATGKAKGGISKAGQFLAGSRAGQAVGRGVGAVKNSATGKFIGGKVSGLKTMAMTGMANIPIIGSRIPKITSALPKGTAGIMQKAGVLGTGALGLMGGVGRGAMKGAKLAGKGVGAVGRGAMGLGRGALGLMGGALGLVPHLALAGMVGGAVVGGVKNMGAGLDDKERARLSKKRGLKKNDNLGLGMAKVSDSLSKFNFNKFWNSFKKSSKKMLPIFKDIFKDIVRIGKQAIPTIFKEASKLSKKLMKELPNMLKSLPKQISKAFKDLSPILNKVWKDFSKGLGTFLSTQVPKLIDGFSKFVGWVANNGVPMIVKGLGKLATFFGTTVVPKLIELGGKFVNWFFQTGLPKILEGFIKLGSSIISHLPEILKALGSLLLDILKLVGNLGLDIIKNIPSFVAKLGSMIYEGVKSALSSVGEWMSSFFSNILGKIIDVALPDVIAKPLKAFLGVHHGGLYMSDDEHPAIIQKQETVLPADKSRKLDDLLTGKTYWRPDQLSSLKSDEKPSRTIKTLNPQSSVAKSEGDSYDQSIKIEKVEIVVKADRLSASDARKQAQQILNEFRKLGKEDKIRNNNKNRNPVLA